MSGLLTMGDKPVAFVACASHKYKSGKTTDIKPKTINQIIRSK